MNSPIPSARDNNQASQADSAGPLSAAGAPTSTIPSTTSQINGTTPRVFSPPAIPNYNSTSNGKDASKHANFGVNGNNMAAPNTNSNGPNFDHGKKPSMTISAAGTSGFIANGTPISATSPRPTINFGSMSAMNGDTPSAGDAAPYHAQSSNLATPEVDARITLPSKSPSPIPSSNAASGGRPPAGFQPPSNAPVFGSVQNGPQGQQMHGGPMPGMNGPELHREPSQSGHGDMNSGMQYGQGPPRNGARPGAGRVPSYGPQGFPQQQQSYSSPQQHFRQLPGRPGQGMPQQFSNHVPNGSPHMASRTPVSSQPSTPHMPHLTMNPQQMGFQPSYGAYANHLSPQSGHYGAQQQYDPNYGYYQPPYQMHPQYLSPQMNQSPGPGRNFRQGQSPQQYNMPYGQAPPPSMSRSTSQMSESHRPSSTAGSAGQQHPAPSTPASSQANHAPSSTPSSVAPPSSNYVIPKREKKGLVIKRPDGEVVTFEKAATPAAPAVKAPTPAPSPSPAPAVSVPTPSPPPTTTAPAETKPTKTKEEIQAEFLARVKASQEDDSKAATEEKSKVEQPVIAKAESEVPAVGEKPVVEKPAEEPMVSPVGDAVDEKPAAPASAPAEPAKPEAEAATTDAPSTAPEASEPAASAKPSAEDDAAEKKRKEDEEMERQMAEWEAEDAAREAAEAEREAAYQAKRKAEKEAAKKAQESQEGGPTDEDLKRAEREAEALEEAREAKQNAGGEDPKAKELFASLAKTDLGTPAEPESEEPANEADEDEKTADAEKPSEPTPGLEDSMHAAAAKDKSVKPKPAPLKLDTPKTNEPAQPTPGMLALKSARFLDLAKETVSYPEGIQSPTPTSVEGEKKSAKKYQPTFLVQFRMFKEKPAVDWDMKLKDSVDADIGSAKSARTPGPPTGGMGPRGSNRPAPPPFAAMGTFGAAGAGANVRGTTSQQRFEMSSRSGPTMSNPLAGMANRPGGFAMGPMPPANRVQSMGAPPPRAGTSSRGGRQGSTRNDNRSRKEDAKANAVMPLTAGMELKAIEVTASGWKPPSLGRPGAAAASPDPSGHMAPDMVQRKVKAALNKMTPERFDKISEQILTIAAQSKDEADGRTLRQVIQLTFDKACDEAHWAYMYAKFCLSMLEQMSNEVKDETILDKNSNPVVGGPLFRKYLLNRCQEEFERGWTVNLPEKKEGDSEEAVMLSDEYYIAEAAKRKGLGLVQFIGELYKLRMLSIKIMHQCFMRLLDFEGMPDETGIESLVKLLRTVGASMAQEQAGPQLLDQYFQRIATIMGLEGLPSRMHFMLLDTVDLRRAGWKSKDDAKGPKTIQEIRDEAAISQQNAEVARQQQNSRGGHGGGRPPAGRGDARNFSGPMAPPDYPRNQVNTEDLRKLGARRQASAQAPRTLGPSSMFSSSRSNSGRPSAMGAAPSLNTTAASSGLGSRTASKADQTPSTPSNAFSALADLDASGEVTDPTPAAVQSKDEQPAASASADSGVEEGEVAEAQDANAE